MIIASFPPRSVFIITERTVTSPWRHRPRDTGAQFFSLCRISVHLQSRCTIFQFLSNFCASPKSVHSFAVNIEFLCTSEIGVQFFNLYRIFVHLRNRSAILQLILKFWTFRFVEWSFLSQLHILSVSLSFARFLMDCSEKLGGMFKGPSLLRKPLHFP